MKKMKLVLALLLFSTIANAQMIEKVVDDMTDEVNYYATLNLIVSNDEKTKGITLHPSIRKKGNNLVAYDLICSIVGLGNCNEKNKLIIMFEDESKINITSWNKFNCKGKAYFELNQSQVIELSTKKIIKIRLTNGQSYESITAEPSMQDYFITFYKELELTNKK